MKPLHRAAVVWSLGRFGSDGSDDALVGDILEEAEAGRPAVWIWRQVFALALTAFSRALRAHPVRIIQALTVGTLALPVAQYGVSAVATGLPLSLRSFAAALVAAWLVTRLDRSHSPAAPVAFAVVYTAITIPWVSSVAITLPPDQSVEHLVRQGATIAMTTIGLLCGGLCSAPRTLLRSR
jgi:hypothetical protein